MFDWLAQQSAGNLIGLAAVVGGPVIAVVAIISSAWSRARRAEMRARQAETEAALKQQMIERGMSVDDIERVLAAGQSNAGKQKTVPEETIA